MSGVNHIVGISSGYLGHANDAQLILVISIIPNIDIDRLIVELGGIERHSVLINEHYVSLV